MLVDARSATERALIAEWAADAHPGGELVEHDAVGAPAAPGASATTRWSSPRASPGCPARATARSTGSMLGDLRALSARRPPAFLQPAVLRRAPGRARVTAGEPAHARTLHGEYETETGGADGGPGFAAFVSRRATLAVDRAERPLDRRPLQGPAARGGAGRGVGARARAGRRAGGEARARHAATSSRS